MVAFSNPAQFREIVYAFQQARIILTAYELEVFSHIAEQSVSSSEVARGCGADHRAMDRLMNALVAIGLLEKKDGLFQNSAFAATYLDKKKPAYLAGFGHTLNMWNTWTGLTDSVISGHNQPRTEKNDAAWTREFIAAMHMRAYQQAQEVVAKLSLDHVQQVLDVGGGSGAYAMAFARQKSDVHTTVFDFPEVLEETKTYVDAAGLSNRISYKPGNYHTDDFGKGYDLIFLSAIVHINSYEENVLLIAKCAKALNPGGQVVIQDHVMEDDRTAPAAGAFFALNMLVATERGDTYTEAEMIDWMKAAGLSRFTRIPTFNNAMLIGIKE
jgi:2-polyprenyl-3-methyl-5-hydroxy-6-metoxy-1,4-benzoquinol methylase